MECRGYFTNKILSYIRFRQLHWTSNNKTTKENFGLTNSWIFLRRRRSVLPSFFRFCKISSKSCFAQILNEWRCYFQNKLLVYNRFRQLYWTPNQKSPKRISVEKIVGLFCRTVAPCYPAFSAFVRLLQNGVLANFDQS